MIEHHQHPSTSSNSSSSSTNNIVFDYDTTTTTVYLACDTVLRISTRSQCIIFLLAALLIPCSAKGKCFNTQMGMSIDGGNYKRIKNLEDKTCARECIEDLSCFGYEWNSEEKTCYLKSRSTSGKLIGKQNTLIGFCIDDEDESRYRLQDHVVIGPIVEEADNVPDGDDCKDTCKKIGTLYYTWRPNVEQRIKMVGDNNEDVEDDPEELLGRCECISTMNEIRLEYDAFSGFIHQPKHKHRRSVFYPGFATITV